MYESIKSIGRIGGADAKAILMTAAKDKDWRVRLGVATAPRLVTMFFNGFVEGVSDDVPGHPAMTRHMQRVSGVVIEPGDRFRVRTVGEPDVGEVGLPGFVR